MRTLTLLLLCGLSVGAWGQTTTIKVSGVPAKPLIGESYMVIFDGEKWDVCESCSWDNVTGTHGTPLSAANQKLCCATSPINPKLLPKPSPVDVPAIQERVLSHKKGDQWGCGFDVCIADHDEYEKQWTCRDKSRTLMETLDGKTHYCHRPQLGP